MRSKRKRTTTKLDNDFVDLDSDELEQLIEEDVPASRNKQQKQNSRDRRTQGASAVAADYEDYQPEDATAGLEATEAAVSSVADVAVGPLQDSDSPIPDAADSNMQIEVAGSDTGRESDSDDSQDSDSSSGQPRKKAKQQQNRAKEPKPRKKRQSTARLCVTYAKAQYRLTDKDLQELTDVEYRVNPHYRRGPPMRLYLVRELEELARRKAEHMARLQQDKEEHAAERAAERALEQRARRAAAAAAAAEAAKAFEPPAQGVKEGRHGSVILPDTCLVRIMTCLANSLEPGGLRGPSAVARDLGAASLACWDFYHAAKAGFEALGEAAGNLPVHVSYGAGSALMVIHDLPGPEALGSWPFWDVLLHTPTSLKLPQLKDAARQLKVMVTGTKAELMVRVLDAFGLSAPTTAPAKLLRMLLLERSTNCVVWDGPAAQSVFMQLTSAMASLARDNHPAGRAAQEGQRRRGAAGVRAAIIAAGFATVSDFIAAGEAAQAAMIKRHQEQMAKLQQRQQELKSRAHPARACLCGNTAAQACSRNACGNCCRRLAGEPGAGATRCARHGM